MLPSPERLRRTSLFQRAYAGKKSVTSALVTLYVLPRQPRSAPKLPHVGFVTAKKIDKRATARNLAKRRVREAYRQTRLVDGSVKQWYAMVWVIQNKALSATWEEICHSVAFCMAKANEKFGER